MMCAHLNNTPMGAGRLDHSSPLTDAIGSRLFDVDVLAGLARPNGCQRMPMIRYGDGNRVNVLVLEQAPNIRIGLRPVASGGLNFVEGFREKPLIDVADGYHFDVWHLRIVLEMKCTLPSD